MRISISRAALLIVAATLRRHRFRRNQSKITPFLSTNGIRESPHLLAEFTHAAAHRSFGGVYHPVVATVFGYSSHVGSNTNEHGRRIHVDLVGKLTGTRTR